MRKVLKVLSKFFYFLWIKRQSICYGLIILFILTAVGTWHTEPVQKILSTTSNSQNITYQDFHLLIPKIKVDVPIIAGVNGQNKNAYFKALENGVAQLQGSSLPGEGSNIFIFGHSSFYAKSPGNYKEIFRNLENLAEGDEIIVWYKNKEYRYKVTETKIVKPSQVDVLKPTKNEQLTLMTCVPPGTTINRLIVIAQPLKP